MNIIDIVTLNKHGDFQEVIFSSLMSYLLNPLSDHGLNHLFLKKITDEVFPKTKIDWSEVRAKSEYPLDRVGTVDIYIEMGQQVIAIEVKIWDRAARNKSSSGVDQVVRYCDYLSAHNRKNDWRFIFLIPTFDSPKCLSEFAKAYSKDYKHNLKLMAWNPASEENIGTNEFSNALIDKSVIDMIADVWESKEIKRSSVPLNTLWLLDSLYEFIPSLKKEVPDAVKFPTKEDLEEDPATWSLFEVFFNTVRRWPSPILTAVGVPYGTGDNKAQLHGNSLYRIRTTRDYYTRKHDKARHLPKNKIELEIWPDVYAEVEEDLLVWMKRCKLSDHAISDSFHIDGKRDEPVKLLSIDRGTPISANDVLDFNAILRSGFNRMLQARA